jgi:hypothetical protein
MPPLLPPKQAPASSKPADVIRGLNRVLESMGACVSDGGILKITVASQQLALDEYGVIESKYIFGDGSTARDRAALGNLWFSEPVIRKESLSSNEGPSCYRITIPCKNRAHCVQSIGSESTAEDHLEIWATNKAELGYLHVLGVWSNLKDIAAFYPKTVELRIEPHR